jgi:hypothetical protein
MGVSMDGTGQVGTYFYTAPEVEQKWPQINEKVITNSLVFFCLKNEQKTSSCEMWLVCPTGCVLVFVFPFVMFPRCGQNICLFLK